MAVGKLHQRNALIFNRRLCGYAPGQQLTLRHLQADHTDGCRQNAGEEPPGGKHHARQAREIHAHPGARPLAEQYDAHSRRPEQRSAHDTGRGRDQAAVFHRRRPGIHHRAPLYGRLPAHLFRLRPAVSRGQGPHAREDRRGPRLHRLYRPRLAAGMDT